MAELLTTTELARRAKVSERTIRNWKAQGLPHKKIGRTVRYDDAEAMAWINQHTVINGVESTGAEQAAV
jgi:excisionase family DNA binding protein